MLSFLKYVNQNMTLRSVPLFGKMSAVFIPKMNRRNLMLLDVVDSQTLLQKYEDSRDGVVP